MKKTIKNIISKISVLVLIVTFIYSVTLIYKSYNTEEVQFFLGYKPVVVSTDSMGPTLNKYDIVLVKKQNFNQAKEGQVVYFTAEENIRSLERITKIEEGYINTKKDILRKDSLKAVRPDDFLGVGLGAIRVSYFLNNPVITGISAIIIGLVLFIIRNLVIDSKLKKKEEQNDTKNKNIDAGGVE